MQVSAITALRDQTLRLGRETTKNMTTDDMDSDVRTEANHTFDSSSKISHQEKEQHMIKVYKGLIMFIFRRISAIF